MIFGTCKVENGSLIVSKTSYVISLDTRPDVRRVFMMPGLIVSAGFSLFLLGFIDLLFIDEILMLVTAIALALIAGFKIAQLTILDRVTRGTDQMSAVYGMHSSLQNVRSEIDEVIFSLRGAHL